MRCSMILVCTPSYLKAWSPLVPEVVRLVWPLPLNSTKSQEMVRGWVGGSRWVWLVGPQGAGVGWKSAPNLGLESELLGHGGRGAARSFEVGASLRMKRVPRSDYRRKHPQTVFQR